MRKTRSFCRKHAVCEDTRRDVVIGLAALAGSAALPAHALPLLQATSTVHPPTTDLPASEVLSSPAVDLHTHAGGRIIPGKRSFDLASRMAAGKFAVVTMTAVTDSPLLRTEGTRIAATRQPQPGELFAHTARQLDAIHAMIASQKFVHVLKPADIAAAHAAGRPAMIIAVEGADFLEGRLDRVKWAHSRGVRHLQLVHYRVNELGDIQTEAPVHKGLTAFGADVVRECNRLGMIVDVAHASLATTYKIAEVSKTPIVMSHGGITTQPPRPNSRMMTLEHAHIIVKKGGVIGLWPNGFIFPKLDAWIEYIMSMIRLIGVDHIGIGTDMEGGINEVFRDYAQFPEIVDGLIKRGLSSADVARIAGGNHARVYQAVATAASTA